MKLNDRTKQNLRFAGAVLFWVAVWQVASMLVAKQLFVPSPLAVARQLAVLLPTAEFWKTAGTSFGRIGLGFLLGLFAGILLAGASAASRTVDILLRPLMLLVRSTPVASFIILALVWVNSRGLSSFISFLMVLPVIYNGTLLGIRSTDPKLQEMTMVFGIGYLRRLRAVVLPALRAPLLSACELGIGMCWKSGVAAEVIGLPEGTIGERLYQTKIFLSMPELFAWTIVIILLSAAAGKLALWLLKIAFDKLGVLGAAHVLAKGDPCEQPHAQTLAGDIVFSGVYKAFGAQQVLRGFSAVLPAGGKIALMGPSGVGKTTILRLVLGLEIPDAGCIDGTAAVRAGCVFQEDRLCAQLSAVGNVALVLPRQAWGGIAEQLMQVGLPAGFCDKPASQLSGGERRRVALVRAVMAQSNFLVLDEAFKGLDEAARMAAHRYVLRHLCGRGLLTVTHDKNEATALGAKVLQVEAAQAGVL